jgi:hypothetical protein
MKYKGYEIWASVGGGKAGRGRNVTATIQVGGNMTPEGQARLGKLMGLDKPAHSQGISKYRQEHIDRANGRKPSVTGTPYWD